MRETEALSEAKLSIVRSSSVDERRREQESEHNRFIKQSHSISIFKTYTWKKLKGGMSELESKPAEDETASIREQPAR